MADMLTITTFLGWCSVINIGLLIFYTIWLMAFRSLTKKIHSALLGIDEEQLDLLYFQFLGNYKLAVIVLNIAPYFALKIMN
jgi:hypothetical protein